MARREILFTCKYCSKGFSTESGFLKHKCDKMRREEQFNTLQGQAAWSHYKQWMMANHRVVPQTARTFLDSRYFNMFYKFAMFVKKCRIPNVKIFIAIMVKNKYTPGVWTTDQAYSKYLEYMIKGITVEELLRISVNTIFDIADAGDVDVSEVFDVVAPNEVIQLLHQRRISPWVLLNSKKFIQFYTTKVKSEERIILESLIDPDYWRGRFTKSPEDLVKVKDCITELGL